MDVIKDVIRLGDRRAIFSLLNRPPARLQIAALCYRNTRFDPEVLLINSRNGNWILPKGWPMKRKTSPEAAAIEAFEEAGVSGRVGDQPIGTYHYSKSDTNGVQLRCVASVYPLEVTEEIEDFPESSKREKLWLSPVEAAERVSVPELRDLLLDFRP